MRNRFKIKLMNAERELRSLSEFIQVHNEDDDTKRFDRLCRRQDKIDDFADELSDLWNEADKLLDVEY